ncbi:MAG: prepilin-type N-terminal cleavage/methylation domain-containing protein [Deltaproteobacteria bacterium]|nr:prepilin-type N-terminal cleavage/methylation domain-containing protein [Deltaproteobacteria bacterium]
MKREEGFTLVELLIVVAIIAILAAIAIPQFSKYRMRSYKSEIDSDTKNAYTAAQAYLTDNAVAQITTIDQLIAGGYQRSQGVTFVNADMDIGSGNIELSSLSLNQAQKHNISKVEFNGKFDFVNSPQ